MNSLSVHPGAAASRTKRCGRTDGGLLARRHSGPARIVFSLMALSVAAAAMLPFPDRRKRDEGSGHEFVISIKKWKKIEIDGRMN
ncbi:hypothetical protein P9302_04690 [Brevibacillus agri]|uniref:hypothetical protein n=1 Tax=Brevibacillus agri TaxID=51101 RepID=UPI002E1BC711|nr:hypothetical protein [Brevibacillus agri]